MSDNLIESFVLTLAGMGTVFVFLTVLVFVTKWAGSLTQKLESSFGSIVKPDVVKTKAPATAKATLAQQDMSEIAAVLAIAHQKYGLPQA